MRAFIIILTILAGVAVCPGEIITVDDDRPADFNNIQAAIDDANDGDTVEIQPGTYTGPGNRDIDFKGKAITVCSANGPGDCIIDCNGTEADPHRGFIFENSEGPTSVLSGLTIINGYSGGGGAVCCRLTSPTIAHCIIAGNRANDGGGLWFGSGWGMSPAFVINCTIAGNTAGRLGGGIYAIGKADVTIINSIVRGNSTPRTQDNDIGIEIRIDAHNPRFTVSYSNIKDGLDGIKYWDHVEWGTGNIDADPCFADAENHDYHLKSQGGRWEPNEGRWTIDDVTSLCIDAGNPASAVGAEPFPNGGYLNMGAFGGTSMASKSYFGKPPCEVVVSGDVDGDCEVNFNDFRFMALRWCEDNNPVAVPEEAWGPMPADGTERVFTYMTMSWNLGALETEGYSASYDVYFGRNPDDLPLLDTSESRSYYVGGLSHSKWYYWRIDTVRTLTEEPFTSIVTPGNVWSFRTIHDDGWAPDPPDGAELVPTEGTMTWDANDVDTTGYTLSYDVYIGTDRGAVANAIAGAPEHAANVSTESYDYANLAGDEEYFWRIDAKLTLTRPPFTSTITPSNVWSFTTFPPIPCKGVGCSEK